MKLGEYLIKEKHISEDLRDIALIKQKKSNCFLGDILIGRGVPILAIYQAIAAQNNLEFVDLFKDEIDYSLIEKDKRDEYFKYKIIPYRNNIFATANYNEETINWAKNNYPNTNLVITSPIDINFALQKHFLEDDREVASELLFKKSPELSAKNIVKNFSIKAISLYSICFLASLYLVPNLGIILFAFMHLFYLVTIISKILFYYIGNNARKKAIDYTEDALKINESDLPIYSILVPLFKEKPHIIQKLLNSLRALNYPKSKLDIKLVVEEDDVETINVIKNLKPERYFEIISVPFFAPRTKPKACNYALRYIRGKLVTIYDAEDNPDSNQLRLSVFLHQKYGDNIGVMQARLNYYNREENLLTKLFAIEYSAWFNSMLYALEYLKIPIPLGGTSNHFKVNLLKDLNAWDPYNVTEDADLGLRIYSINKAAKMMNSTTMEEAANSIKKWIGQRSRWIKGHIQTYLVHMRNPKNLFKNIGANGFFGISFFLGAPVLVFLTLPLMFGFSVYLIYNNMLPNWLGYLTWINLVFGIIIHMMMAIDVVRKEKWPNMILSILCFPFYWIMHIIASSIAIFELFTAPHYWRKTEHG